VYRKKNFARDSGKSHELKGDICSTFSGDARNCLFALSPVLRYGSLNAANQKDHSLLIVRNEENKMRLLHKIKIILPSLFLLSIGTLTSARADTVAFIGSRFEEAPAAGAGGRCAPTLTLIINSSVGTATGTSNLGTFTADENACFIVPFPVSIADGIFTFTFDDGGTLTGTFSGIATRVNLPDGGHLLNINQDYIITGGTGSFFDATGNIAETGTGMSTGIFAFNNYTFEGTITAPGLSEVPEPSTLALISTGILGAAMKFGRTCKARSALASTKEQTS
jgi:PEP-CTERM motif